MTQTATYEKCIEARNMWPFSKTEKSTSQPSIDDNLSIDPKAIGAICRDLQTVLDAEIRAGNEIIGADFSDWPFPNCSIITLKRIFLIKNHQTSASLSFEVFDPHGTPESYYCQAHNQIVFAAMPTLWQFKSGRLRSSSS